LASHLFPLLSPSLALTHFLSFFLVSSSSLCYTVQPINFVCADYLLFGLAHHLPTASSVVIATCSRRHKAIISGCCERQDRGQLPAVGVLARMCGTRHER
jgi:hypothetical protein